MRSHQIIALTVLLALVLGWAWWGRSQPEAIGSESASSPAAQGADRSIADTTPGWVHEPRAFGQPARAPNVSELVLRTPSDQAQVLRDDHGLRPEEFERNRLEIFAAFQSEVTDWTPADFFDRADNRAALTGREAYEVYVYLRSCLGQPESVEQVDQQIDQIERQIERFNEADQQQFAEQLLSQIDSLDRGLTRCESVGTDGTGIPLMHDWLALSADLGFAQAQIAYHASARWILSMQPNDLFRNPDLVVDYRRRATDYLQSALLAGHPDALLEMAKAIDDGIVFRRNAQAAYAYAFGAQQGGGGQELEAESFATKLERELSASELREARERGRALCERYCRGS